MALDGQVEQAVGGMQVRVAAVTVGHTLHVDLTEDARQAAVMAGLDGPVGDPIGVDRRGQASLGSGAHREVILQHPPQQLAAPAVELVLQLAVLELASIGSVQPLECLLEASARGAEARRRLRGRFVHRRRLRNVVRPSAARASNSLRSAS